MSHQTQFFNANNSGSTPDAVYYYDGAEKRVKKTSSNEITIFACDTTGEVIAEYSTKLAATPQVSYMTQDHLGSPRVMTDENGNVTNRKDFMAFGDEVVSAQRVSGNKYVSTPDEVRKDYTGYEKDIESGLEYAQARYYSSTQGRYTTIDPLTASATIRNPQTFNRYSYVLNSPYKFTDPLGLLPMSDTGYRDGSGGCGAEFDHCGDGMPEHIWIEEPAPESHTSDAASGSATSDTAAMPSHETQPTTTPPAPPPFVVLFWGGGSSLDGEGGDIYVMSQGESTSGLGETKLGTETKPMAATLKNEFPNATVVAAGPDSGERVLKMIADSGTNNIIIEGYSRGAYAAVNLANDLVSKGYDVDQVTTVDPSDLAVSGPKLDSVGKHIGSAVNYNGSSDGRNVSGDGVVNIALTPNDRKFDRTPFIHTNMLDIASPKVLSRIRMELQYIQKTQ